MKFVFSFKNVTVDGQQGLKILTAEHAKLLAMINVLSSDVHMSAYLENFRLLIENRIKQLECKIKPRVFTRNLIDVNRFRRRFRRMQTQRQR